MGMVGLGGHTMAIQKRKKKGKVTRNEFWRKRLMWNMQPNEMSKSTLMAAMLASHTVHVIQCTLSISPMVFMACPQVTSHKPQYMSENQSELEGTRALCHLYVNRVTMDLHLGLD